MRSYMVVYGISKMLHCAIERFLISILMKINFFVLFARICEFFAQATILLHKL